MQFSRKINKLLIRGTSGFIVVWSGLLANNQINITQTAVAQVTQVVQALSPEEVNLRAKQIIVRIDGASVGSGSLIEHSDDTYSVLTNWHVMKNQGEYVVTTIDGRKHPVDSSSIKRIPGIDLAIFQFTSNQNYQVAELGNSANLNEGQSVYFAGYPGELRREDNRYYRFFSANLVGILPRPTENGYAIIYNGEAFPGMSGGPVFNREGLVIGIHGEANVHALSGGTSNYAIPINTYQNAIANLNQQPETTATTNNPTPSPPAEEEVEPEVATNPTPEASESKQPEASEEVSSVPTFTPNPVPPKPVPEEEKSPGSNSETIAPNESELMDESSVLTEEEKKASSNATAVKPEPKPEVESETTEVDPTTNNQKIALVSQKTGIDYTPLRDLLKQEKWSEADIKTYGLVEEIVSTAKQNNKHIFIELKSIAEFSCPDIRTIDSLWQKYTGNKFGFSSQQEVWQSVNQTGDFSTKTWRRFATEVGWKKGDVTSGSGYLLYDSLDFDPTQAPTGHLPWWFALPDEEQKVIKHLFARCNFNPTPQELAAEEGRKPEKPENNAWEENKKPENQPAIEKTPK